MSAARILETAVGEALGPAEMGGDRRSDDFSDIDKLRRAPVDDGCRPSRGVRA